MAIGEDMLAMLRAQAAVQSVSGDGYELRYQAGERLDEVVATGANVHLEQMGDDLWWLGIDMPDGTRIAINLYTGPDDADGASIYASVEVEPGQPTGRAGGE